MIPLLCEKVESLFPVYVFVGFGFQSVTLHTNLGDLKCEVFCDEVPKAAEVLLSPSLPTILVSFIS